MNCESGYKPRLTPCFATKMYEAVIAAAFAFALVLASGPVRADVYSGITAYESGNFEVAATEFQKHPGDVKAAYYLGLMHEAGRGGLLKNYATALNWFQKSGLAGYIEAQLKAASMYEQGLGAPQSSKRAAEWYRRAAEKGDARGQLRLGMMYRDGEGVPRDRYRASLWLGRAGEQGNSEAIGALDELRRRGLISERELAARLAGVPESELTLTARGQRVREQLAHILGPVKFLIGDSKQPLSAGELDDHWIIVEREDDVLALLPKASVLTDEGDVVEVGTIRIVAMPQANDILDFTLSIPSKLTVRSATAQVISTIVHDRFEISGKWSEAIRTSLDVGILWSGVHAFVIDSAMDLDVEAISGLFTLTQIEPAIWRQTSGFEVSNVHARSSKEQSVFRIGRLAFKSEVDGAHPDAYRQFVGRYLPGFQPVQQRKQDPPGHVASGAKNSESEIATVLGRRIEMSLEFSDLFGNAGDGSPPMELASASFHSGLSDLDQHSAPWK